MGFSKTGASPFKGVPGRRNLTELRKERHMLVPDTLEWSGGRPRASEWQYGPVKFVTAGGWPLSLPIFDRTKGRTISVSTCTGLATPLLPFADDAWAFLGIVEAAADEHLARGWKIARVDFARDLRVPNSIAWLKDAIRRAANTDLPIEAYRMTDRLGITFPGVAGGDRLRIYHKGLESKHKYAMPFMDSRVADVIRVELQLRKGQLDERQRVNVQALQTARVEPEPRETDAQVIRLKPMYGRKVRKRHLYAMNRDWRGRRVHEATEAVDCFLMEQGFDQLLPGAFGTELPDPLYGEAST
ncbi:MAG: hypothetical protein V3T86_01660 [Planctomycetota bacterium]